MSQLPSDCLNEIFEYLEEDKDTLRSCLLVNRLWCETSVRILWRRIRNYNTLISCLPNELKEALYKSRMITSTSILKPPMFNYASFCRVLYVNNVIFTIQKQLSTSIQLLEIQQPTPFPILSDMIAQEIFKLLMNQNSLKKLKLHSYPSSNIQNFASFPGAKDCLSNLTELRCNSNIYPEFFCKLSQTCHNIQLFDIELEKVVPSGLANLISTQQNLKYLKITNYEESATNINTLFANLPDTLIKLNLHTEYRISLSFITKLTRLQEIMLSLQSFEGFNELQYITIPHLKVLKFEYEYPRFDFLIKFLENNGKNLKEFYITESDDSLNLAMVRFCPNLKKLYIGLTSNGLEVLKMVFSSYQYLESIKIRCSDHGYLGEKDLFEIIVKYSPTNFYELKLSYALYNLQSKLLLEELESFFMSWGNRISRQPLSLIIIRNDTDILYTRDEYMEIIEKYTELGIIEEFKVMENDFDDFDDEYNE